MKSRKSVRRSNSRGDQSRKALLNSLRSIEHLEKRELLASDFEVKIRETGNFFDQQSADTSVNYLVSRFGDQDGSQGGEGGPNDTVNVTEVEPNNTIVLSQAVPLGGNFGVNIAGTNPIAAADEDWFGFDLEAGAILDARLIPTTVLGLPIVSLYDASGQELMASSAIAAAAPPESPLAGSPNDVPGPNDISLHYVIPATGRYHVRVSDSFGGYTLQLRQYRAPLESQDFGNHQILFLDFDGATVHRSMFGFGVGSARLSPTRSFLPAYGIQDSDYDRFVDEVVARVQNKFDDLATKTTNPDFKIEIRNSKDDPDPWGLPNVSRVVIGGTFQELVGDPTAPSGLLGIAQSVDAGNFALEETALVMHDVLINTFPSVPIDPFARPVEVISELMAMVVTHEAGHYFGGRHQDPNNNIYGIMDQFYAPLISSGAGNDGIFGNADDEPLYFNVDGFTPTGNFLPGGVDDTINWVGWGLTSGQANASIAAGQVFNDANANGLLDGVDSGLANVQVYSDINGNSVLDAGEPVTTSAIDGSYQLRLPAGSHTIREVVPAGYRLTTPAGVVVTTSAGNTTRNVNFGNAVIIPEITGLKWNDLNGNGIREASEPGLAGVWIYIDEDGDNRIDIGEPATQTRPDGTYSLTFGGAGTYTIREVVDTGFVQTFPGAATDFEHTITLTGDPAIDLGLTSGLDFGNLLTVDYGDAPESYGSASHGFVDGLRLGTEWDSEQASLFSANALGDDVVGSVDGTGATIDDEDGVVFTRPIVAGSVDNRISITAQNTTGNNAFVSGWIDFNQDGVFSASERIITNFPVATGSTDITFVAPSGATLGDTFARFRYSSEANLGPTGLAASGEVEDYAVNVTDTFTLAVDDRFSVARNSIQNSLDVLANDFQLPGENLQIISFDPSMAGGTVQISPQNTILYTPPSGFVGQDSFSYTMRNSSGDIGRATVVVDVNLRFDNPVAIDDSFTTSTNIIDFPLNVLANDIEGQNGALTIVSVTQPDKGGQLSIATGGKSLRYTPSRDFGGTEFFTYTVADASGARSSATATVHTLPGDRADDDVLIEFVATDLAGNPISAVQQGEDFQIRLFVDDLRFSSTNPGTASGVFAAYTDMLYSLQLVSTIPSTDANSQFSFETRFLNDYTNGLSGDATIPGIIDEFGAFTSRSVMQENDRLLMATVTFNARSPGIADFTPDPADDFPASDTLLFDTPGSAVPLEKIRYIGTQLEIVGDGIEFPVAVDDSLPNAIPAGSTAFPVDVLENDLPGSTGVIQIVSTSNGLSGTTFIDNNGTPNNPADDQVLYTPNTSFNGADQFTYTIEDSRGIQSTATVTVRVGTADADDIVSLNIVVTDVNGQPIDEVQVGDQFQVRGFVQDLRGFGIDRGVFAGYEDVLYSRRLVSPVASTTNDPNLGFEVQFGPNYQRVREGDIRTAGVINEIGAVQIENNNQPLGSAEHLLFVVTMTANSTGTAEFIADPADISPLHDTLTFEPPEAVPFDKIRYGFDTVNIVGSGGTGSGEYAQNPFNQFDVNADGFVSPLDVLLGIHELNNSSRGNSGGEGESHGLYLDVSGDGHLSPIDPLLVINHLNQRNGASGEGEGESAFIDVFAEDTAAPSGNLLGESLMAVEIHKDESGRITARDTTQTYGPAPANSSIDSIFGDDAEEEDLDTLLSQLAPEIDETWRA